MSLIDYFDKTTGMGVLATSDAQGMVNAAVYGRPHFIDEENIAFIMAERLSHKNIQSNPHAVYLFKESGEKYSGKRLYLTEVREEKDSPMIAEIRRRKYPEVDGKYPGQSKYLVYFHIDRVLPLIGDGKEK